LLVLTKEGKISAKEKPKQSHDPSSVQGSVYVVDYLLLSLSKGKRRDRIKRGGRIANISSPGKKEKGGVREKASFGRSLATFAEKSQAAAPRGKKENRH